jgi:hypothetical protein
MMVSIAVPPLSTNYVPLLMVVLMAVPDREPETTYYVRVKSYPTLPGNDTASNYSAAQAIRTLAADGLPGGGDNVVSSLQNWLLMIRHTFGDFPTP